MRWRRSPKSRPGRIRQQQVERILGTDVSARRRNFEAAAPNDDSFMERRRQSVATSAIAASVRAMERIDVKSTSPVIAVPSVMTNIKSGACCLHTVVDVPAQTWPCRPDRSERDYVVSGRAEQQEAMRAAG